MKREELRDKILWAQRHYDNLANHETVNESIDIAEQYAQSQTTELQRRIDEQAESFRKIQDIRYEQIETITLLKSEIDRLKAENERLGKQKQLCPKCNGQGIVSKPPYVAGDVHEWSSTASTFICDVCKGSKIF